MIKKESTSTIIITAAVWLITWLLTQGLFMSNILTRIPGELNMKYIITTAWVLIVFAICLTAIPRYRSVSLPQSKLLWLYAIPATLLALLPWHYQLALQLPVYIVMIIITVSWQDYLTFGVLQPHLATKMSATSAAILTALLFLLGHAIFFFHNLADPQFLLIAGAGLVFAFTRRYTGNVYIANILHLCFYLI